MLHEVDVGHFPIIATHSLSGALLPLIFLPLTLLSLIAVQLWPTRATEVTLLVLSLVNIVIGAIGFFFHLAVNGVTFDHLGKIFSFSLWSSPAGPNWPLAISFGGLFALVAVLGAGSDDGFIHAAPTGLSRLSRDVAFLGIIAAIILTGWLTTFGIARIITVVTTLLLSAIVAVEIAARVQKTGAP